MQADTQVLLIDKDNFTPGVIITKWTYYVQSNPIQFKFHLLKSNRATVFQRVLISKENCGHGQTISSKTQWVYQTFQNALILPYIKQLEKFALAKTS